MSRQLASGNIKMPHVQMSDIVSMSLTIFAFSAPAACGTIEYMALRATIHAREVGKDDERASIKRDIQEGSV
jgi:hypothetical protein